MSLFSMSKTEFQRRIAFNNTIQHQYKIGADIVYQPNASANITGLKTHATFDYKVYVSVGIFLALLFVFGFSENVCVLYVYFKNKKLRTYKNALLIGLALSDLGQAVFNIPLVTISAFLSKWTFGQGMCQYYGFVTTMFGLTQISILTIIALERYLLIAHHKTFFSRSLKTTMCTVVACFLNGAFWSSAPLLGWSGYTMEYGGISCTIDWNLHDIKNGSYVFSLFGCVWFLPLVVISFSYARIVHMVFKEKRRKRHVFNSMGRKNITDREQRVAMTCLIMTGFFVITWLPYSVVAFWAAVDHIESIPGFVRFSTALFAKSSIIWNPIIYFVRHEHFRSGCVNSLICFRLLATDKLPGSAVTSPTLLHTRIVISKHNTFETNV